MDRLEARAASISSACSIGGWIAAEIATKVPERIGRLVLVGPVGVKIGPVDKLDIPDIFAMPTEKLDQAAASTTRPSIQPDPAKLPRRAARHHRCATARRWRCWPGSRTCTIPSSSIACTASTSPTLFMRGASDGIVSADYLAALCEAHRRSARSRPSRKRATCRRSSSRRPDRRTVLRLPASVNADMRRRRSRP